MACPDKPWDSLRQPRVSDSLVLAVAVKLKFVGRGPVVATMIALSSSVMMALLGTSIDILAAIASAETPHWVHVGARWERNMTTLLTSCSYYFQLSFLERSGNFTSTPRTLLFF